MPVPVRIDPLRCHKEKRAARLLVFVKSQTVVIPQNDLFFGPVLPEYVGRFDVVVDQMIGLHKAERLIELRKDAFNHFIFRDHDIFQCSLLIDGHDLIVDPAFQIAVAEDRHQ